MFAVKRVTCWILHGEIDAVVKGWPVDDNRQEGGCCWWRQRWEGWRVLEGLKLSFQGGKLILGEEELLRQRLLWLKIAERTLGRAWQREAGHRVGWVGGRYWQASVEDRNRHWRKLEVSGQREGLCGCGC